MVLVVASRCARKHQSKPDLLRKESKGPGENNHEHNTMKMMTRDDIQSELGWTDSMIHSLLRTPDSPNARRDRFTGGYTYGLYHRDRVLAVAQSTEGQAAKRRWDETYLATRPTQAGQYASAI
jgi:hypothetical protein